LLNGIIAVLAADEALASKTVFRGFIAIWFLAASPIRRSYSVKARYDGVVLLPW
jgi:hypothetical protein